MKKQINSALVILTAEKIIQQQGIEFLTLNSLSVELGIKTPSLYNHISSLSDLRLKLAIHGMEKLIECIKNEVIGKSKKLAILSAMNSYRNFVKNNAGLYSIMLQKYESSADLDDLKSDFIHVISLILKPYNLGSKDEVHVIRGLRSFIHGFTDLEIKGGFQMNVDVDTSFAKFADVLISSIEEI